MKSTTKPNFAKAQAAMIAITTGLAMLAVLAIQTMIWGMEAYAIPAAHRSIVAIAKTIKAKPPSQEPTAIKELSPAPEPIPQPSPIPDNVAIAIAEPEAKPVVKPASKPKAKSQGKRTPKDKTIAALIIAEAVK
jgi:hypothetical protein